MLKIYTIIVTHFLALLKWYTSTIRTILSFLFSIYFNHFEEEISLKGSDGIDIGIVKLFLLFFAYHIVLFADSADVLQSLLEILQNYCQCWK